MTERRNSRRAFLGGIAGVGASAAMSSRASAQSSFQINDPNVVQEIEALFMNYDLPLRSNDVAALNGYFLDSPFTVRFGNAENLYGSQRSERIERPYRRGRMSFVSTR